MTPSDAAAYPLIPLRDIVVFPNMVVTLFVGRSRSVEAVYKSLEKHGGHICLATQKDPHVEDPDVDDLFPVGVMASIAQMVKMPDGALKILVDAQERVFIKNVFFENNLALASVRSFPTDDMEDEAAMRLSDLLKTHFLDYARMSKKLSADFKETILESKDLERAADMIASHLEMPLPLKQSILETVSLVERLEKILSQLLIEMDALELEERIRSRVQKQIEKNQREYYLSEQMKAIQSELHHNRDGFDELDGIEQKLLKSKMPDSAREKGLSDLRKLRQMNPMSAEAGVLRGYLDWLTALPFKKHSRLKNDLKEAKKILNADHYGLEKVKDRILEHLAVQKRLGKTAGQILCFVGPPGVGKTSLGQSIADATGRKFVRISLGGMRDEAEIRGHRRTYIGAMPGRIIQAMKRAGTSNPVILLDEIDKLGSDFRGDPSAALLEVLDPAQNKTFNDHYLEIDYDLSEVLFITTANSLNMSRPLKDRMEIISISGYTEEEKLRIASDHLLEKQRRQTGLKKDEVNITRASLLALIRSYTREAGVRNLERTIGTLCRKALKDILEGKKEAPLKISPPLLKEYLGAPPYRFGQIEESPMVGVCTGLAWTEVGGELLTIEVAVSDGKGKLILTGKLGEVMQESIQAALSYIRSRTAQFGIDPDVFQTKDIHVHVPEGATPKDGPSAGIAIYTALVSILTGIPVRPDIAMTGEITLRGRVLAIGGLKEKLLAAQRGGVKVVLIPEDNRKDLDEIQDTVKKGMTIHLVSDAAAVLAFALAHPLDPSRPSLISKKNPLPGRDLSYPTGSPGFEKTPPVGPN